MVKVIEQSLQRYAACFAHSAAPLLRENARDLMPLFHAARVCCEAIAFVAMRLDNPVARAQMKFDTAKGADAKLMPVLRSAVLLAERLVLSTELWDANRLDVLDLACRIGLRKVRRL